MKILCLILGLLAIFSCREAPEAVASFDSGAVNLMPRAIINHYRKPDKGFFFLTTYKTGRYDEWDKCFMMILDERARPIYFRNGKMLFDFKLQRDSVMSFFAGERHYFMDSGFRITDSVGCVNGVVTDLHDIQITRSGNYLLIGKEKATLRLPEKYRSKFSRDSVSVDAGVIQELDRNKKLIFEWHAKDHFAFGDIADFFLGDTLNKDWTHFNAVEEDLDGNLLLTVRNFNEVSKIRKSDGKIVWRLGGKNNQFRFTNGNLPLLAMHDARRMPDGHITLYDNGHAGYFTRHPLRALELDLDEVQKTATVAWSCLRKIYSKGRGNVQHLGHGEYLINYGEIRDYNSTLEITDSACVPILELYFADTLGAYRAFFYRELPAKLQRPVIRVKQTDKGYHLDAGHYKRYLWSTGDTTREIYVRHNGEYFVFVPPPCGGWLASEPVQIPPALTENRFY